MVFNLNLNLKLKFKSITTNIATRLKDPFTLNTLIVGGSKLVENLFSYLIFVLISRQLGFIGLGIYSFIFSFVAIFFLFTDWGLMPMTLKDLSKDFSKADTYINNIFSFKIFLAIISFIIFIVYLQFTNTVFDNVELLWFLIGAALVQSLNVLWGFKLIILQIKTEGVKIAIVSIIERFVALLGATIALMLFDSLLAFIWVLVASNVIKLLLFSGYANKYHVYRWSAENIKKIFCIGVDFKFIKNLVVQGFPFVLITAFSLIYIRMDTVMLGFMSTQEVVGFYNAGYKIIDLLSVIPSLLLIFGFPMLSKLFIDNREQAKKLFQRMMLYSLTFVLPVIGVIFWKGNELLRLIYGSSTIQTFTSLKILSVALVFIYATSIMGYFLASMDKQKIFAWIAGIGAAINIILNFILIPHYSLYGAGFATLITYFVMFSGMSIYIYIYVYKNKPLETKAI